MPVCDECARTFEPEHNEYAHGFFYWEEAADKAFNAVELNIPHTDPRYANVVGMLENGQSFGILSRPLGYNKPLLYIVDGKVWLRSVYNVLRLGDMDHVRENFPGLLEAQPKQATKENSHA
jgi:hypothetical protein